ncbi:MAG: cbb3-type cytochrome c oxidase subunit I [Acidobacteriota bacterium]
MFSLDHKVIGLQYAITSLIFLLIGFTLMMMMRWQLAYPGSPIPLVGSLLGATNAPGGIIGPELYNQLGAMHGTIMIFLGVVPLSVGGFGNYLVPLQIGAPDMAFPRLNMLSYWVYAAGGLIMLGSFFLPGGAANSGWTSYPPLSVLSQTSGQTAWLAGMLFLITSSLFGSINTIVTIVQLRAPGLTFMRLPFFIWAQLVTAFLLLLAFPPLQSASLMQLMDRVVDTSFFLPTGLVVGNRPLARAGGGNPLMWQHLFWFLAHPEVYVLILPAMGIVAEVLTANTRKPLWGYRLMVYAAIFLGFMSMLVWAHHMFMTGMGTAMSAFFQTTTMIVSIPSVVILSAFFVSLYGGSIRFTVPALFALAFLPMFGLGGLTGLPLGLAASDIPLHDTYYVIGHFHYIVAPGTLFALFAGIYHWFPKATGRQMSERWGRVHFVGSFVCMNLIFMPMFAQGLAGLNRRLYDGGITYAHGRSIQHWNVVQGWSAWVLGLFQLVFIVNLFVSWRRGRRVSDNPWNATTLEWATASPPPHGNFATPMRAFRGPYEYSVPGSIADFTPQWQASANGEPDAAEWSGHGIHPEERSAGSIPYTTEVRPDTGVNNVTLGMWLFIASEVMLFGGLFSAYLLLRSGAPDWPRGRDVLDIGRGTFNTILLAGSAVAAIAARRAAANGAIDRARGLLAATAAAGVIFLCVKASEYLSAFSEGIHPATSIFFALYFLLTAVHVFHVLGGVVVNGYLSAAGTRSTGGDTARFKNRVGAIALYWNFIDVVWVLIFVSLYVL